MRNFRLIFGVVVLFGAALFGGCTQPQPNPSAEKSIVILYENDVHCAIDRYTNMRGMRDVIVAADTSEVAMVCSGDFLQGALAGAISQGKYIVDIMQYMGYDAATLGNHEFDYGVPRMVELLPQIGTNIVCANLFEAGGTQPMYAPYVIRILGKKKIAFVGVTTPGAMVSEGYSFYDDGGQLLYDLRENEVNQLVQAAVDNARREGADYVIVLSHLGERVDKSEVTSHTLIAATNGIDAVLDGHTHSVIECEYVNNKDGQPVPVTQTGTQFANFGHLWISPEGKMVMKLIATTDNPYVDPRVSAVTDSVNDLLNQRTGRPVATLAFNLPVKNSDGSWIVRSHEAPIGNLVSDAFRAYGQADIGLTNGGGLRNGLTAGTVTYGDVVSVLPFDNYLTTIEASGSQIQTMLTMCCKACPQPNGEFPHVAGMHYTIHTLSHTVTDVEVYDAATDAYVPLEAEKKYTIACTDYYKSGFAGTLKDCRIVRSYMVLSRDVLADYMETTLGGSVPDRYSASEGRITITD